MHGTIHDLTKEGKPSAAALLLLMLLPLTFVSLPPATLLWKISVLYNMGVCIVMVMCV